MPEARYLWHYDLHRTIASEHLCFLGLTFTHTYDRTTALAQLRLALRGLDIPSFTVWELIGEIDLMVQVWLPPRISLEDLKTKLAETAEYPHLFTVDTFSVDHALHHWLWSGKPADRVGVPDQHMIDLNGPNSPPARVIKSYISRGLVAEPHPRKSIKFFLRITQGDRKALVVGVQSGGG